MADVSPSAPTGPAGSGRLARLAARARHAGVAPRLRLWTGLVLFAFAATHLANHALGLVSLAAMERGRGVFLAPWRVPPVEALLFLSLLVHPVVSLALRLVGRTAALTLGDAVQLATGLLIPILLTIHLLGTSVLEGCCGVDVGYTHVVDLLWPGGAWRQSLLLVVVWLHGCLGLHLWLRLKPGYPRFRAPLLAAAVLLPALALTGFVSAGREVERLRAAEPGRLASLAAEQNWPAPEERAWIYVVEDRVLAGFAGLVGALLLLRTGRRLWHRRTRVRLTYPGGRVVAVPRGSSVLEASLSHGVPHASVCGGRGRCSTCRVRVGPGRERLPPPSAEEARVLARFGATADVRLACQIRPAADLVVAPLLPADAGLAAARRQIDPGLGAERELVVLFADLRGFTRLSEGRLPYDVVFILNRYFRAMGGAVEAAGGRVDKLIGDGVMALFGLGEEPGAAARAALDGARRMGAALADLNAELSHELARPLRMGIGLHLGPVIVGEMGYGPATQLTAIGDTVNVASRLETATKDFAVELVLSEEVRLAAGVPLEGLAAAARHTLTVRGRGGELTVWALPRAADLPPPPDVTAETRPSLLRRLRLPGLPRRRTA